jgi:hypothetical protein
MSQRAVWPLTLSTVVSARPLKCHQSGRLAAGGNLKWRLYNFININLSFYPSSFFAFINVICNALNMGYCTIMALESPANLNMAWQREIASVTMGPYHRPGTVLDLPTTSIGIRYTYMMSKYVQRYSSKQLTLINL